MKKYQILFFLVLLGINLSLFGETRKWTSGPYSMEGELIELSSNDTEVILQDEKGKKIIIQIKLLSEEDRAWIDRWKKEKNSKSDANNPFRPLIPKEESTDSSHKESEKPQAQENKESEKTQAQENKESEKTQAQENEESKKPQAQENKESEKPQAQENKESEKPQAQENKESEKPQAQENKESEKPQAQENKESADEYYNSQEQKFKLIPAGEFMMGDTLTPEKANEKYPGGKVEWFEDAHPRHRVKITRPYYMGIYEVTVRDFRKFTEATKYKTTAETFGSSYGYDKENNWGNISGLNWCNPSIHQEDTHPVVSVSWNDAQAYVRWLNKTDTSRPKGYDYSLPTEAQWEYACRAGSETEFFWGDEPEKGDGYLNGAGEECNMKNKFSFNDKYKETAPVGSFKPNKYGLYDIYGNVCEWCADWYEKDYYKYCSELNPIGPDSGIYRTIRGGCWLYNGQQCRSAYRASLPPDYRSFAIGFRLVLIQTND